MWLWKLLKLNLSFCLLVIREECKRRRWYGMLKIIYGILGVLLLVLAPVITLTFTLDLSKRTTAIILLSEFIIFLFVVINFARTYHERVGTEVLDRWQHDMSVVDSLYDAKVEGRRLDVYCDQDHPNLKHLLENWNTVVLKRLNNIDTDLKQKYGVNAELKKRYYEGSRTGEYLPDDASEWQQWVRDRNLKLNTLINEFKEPPPQLVSSKEIIQNRY
jgi:hypothetical protein